MNTNNTGKQGRCFHFVQYFENPRTGEKLLDDDYEIEVQKRLDKKKLVKFYAIIIHDKDIYTKEDEDNHLNRLRKEYKKTNDNSEDGLFNYIQDNQYVFEGKPKPKHIHIIISTKPTPTSISRIAELLSYGDNVISENYIDIPHGRGAFEDCLLYITHIDDKQQAKGKYVYDSSEVIANFDYDDFVSEYNEEKKTGKPRDKRLRMLYEVRNEGKKLNQCCDEDFELYIKLYDKLKKMRLEFLKNADPPELRFNIYVYGEGGVGKDILCRILARQFFPGRKDEDIFYVVGANKVSFEGYDGQPVIIWSDRRAGGLITELGRENLLNILDPHPQKTIQHIKYGSVNLINSINIINGQETYNTFLNSLSGEYYSYRDDRQYSSEDKKQFYRRFPIILPVREKDYDLYVNKGWINNSHEFKDYIVYKNIRMNLSKLVKTFPENGNEFNKVASKAVETVVETANLIIDKQNKDFEQKDINEFEEYGRYEKKYNGLYEVSCDVEYNRYRR